MPNYTHSRPPSAIRAHPRPPSPIHAHPHPSAAARHELAPDLDAVTALAPEREALWRRVSGAEFLSDVEKRVLLGLPPEPPA